MVPRPRRRIARLIGGTIQTPTIGGARSRKSGGASLPRRVPTFDLDVCRLQVTMDDALVVGRFQRSHDLFRDGQRLVARYWTSGDLLGQRLAFDQFEDERAAPA
jgi:hypothetical protein